MGKAWNTVLRAAQSGAIRLDKSKRPFLVHAGDLKAVYAQPRIFRGGYKGKQEDTFTCTHVTPEWLCGKMASEDLTIYAFSARCGIGYHLIARDRRAHPRGEAIPEARRKVYASYFEE